MLDDLRKTVDDNDPAHLEDDEEEIVSVEESAGKRSQLFLGMTPVERMFLSMFLFLNVAILGIALLVVTGRMG